MTSDPDQTGGYDPLDAIIGEYLQAVEAGTAPPRDELLAQHPHLADRLRAFFTDFDGVGRDASKFRLPDPQETVGVGDGRADLPKVRYLGDYELIDEIARGGMGVVYRARQVSLNRPVAVKMILAGTYATEQAVQRFRAEAEAAANLDHPHILPIYEVGEHDGHQYFSMKLVEGGSLAGQVEQFRANPKRTAELVATLARAVHFAHQRGILHRDLKPSNILLDADGTPYVTDFGLAKRVDADDGSTRTGAVVGTPSYMAPEQARGEKGLTTSADVYSLGAVLYELLAGQPPFKGESVFTTLKQVMEVEPTTPPGDRDLGVIALKCLNKDPAMRYGTAAEMADDLERWQRGEAITARPVGRVEKLNKWMRRNKAVTALGLSLFVAMCFGIGMSIKAAGEADRRAIAAEASEAVLKLERDETAKVSAALQVSEGLAQSRLYVSQVRLAQSASDQLQVGQAKRALDDTAPDLRGWEYYHLKAAADTSYRTVKLTRRPGHHLALSPDGKSLGYSDGWDHLYSLKLCKDAREADFFDGTHRGRNGPSVAPTRDRPSLLFSEDQREFYLFAVDGLKHYRFEDGKETVFGHINPEALRATGETLMGALVYSPDRKRIYSSGRGKLTCWNRADLKEMWSTPIGDQGECWAVAVSADENLFAVWVQNLAHRGQVKVYDRKQDKWVFDAGPYDVPRALRLTPDGKRLLMQQYGLGLAVWDVGTAKLLSCPSEWGNSMELHPTGKLAIQGMHNGDVVFFDVDQLKELARIRAHTDSVEHVVFSPDGALAATAGADKTIHLWDVPNRRRLRVLTGHTAGIRRLHFTPDGKTLVSGSADFTVKWWATDAGGPVVTLPLPEKRDVVGWAWLNDSERMVTAQQWWGTAEVKSGTAIEVWNTLTDRRERVIGTHGRLICSLAVSADGQWLLTGNTDYTAKLWDMRAGKEVRTHFTPTPKPPSDNWGEGPTGTRLLILALPHIR
jgi:WD40 repeat protein